MFKKAYLENIYIGKYSGDLSLIIKFENECTDYTEYSDGKIVVTGSDQIFYFYFDNKTTKEDQERFLKAFRHLAQLCGAKEKPKVKKNTF
ncbi:hypothetical protein [Tenacibaculum aestuarii]|uniref:hypothetical protein n=1 Tax=Tenacibaculum aestuarii TaxID=362781 RepID=UPI003892CFA7